MSSANPTAAAPFQPRTRLSRVLRAVVVAAVAMTAPFGAANNGYGERFDTAWELVNTRYWNIERTGVDWAAVGEEYRPRAVAAETEDAFYAIVTELYGLLGDQHSVFVPPARVAEVRQAYGDLPCVVTLGAALPGVGKYAGGGLSGAAHIRLTGVPTSAQLTRLANVSYALTDNGVAYIALPDLATDGAAEAVRSAVKDLEAAGATALVLDLRGNPGGRLVTMMQVAGVFTSGLLWRTVTSWSLPLPYPAIGLTQTQLPMAVLIDGNVHSAAEGLAGALQARGRAIVVGQTSAGNVEALLPFCLRDGSQAWIATGVLAPLLGATWEGRGVQPDVATEPQEAFDVAVGLLLEQRQRQ